MEAATNNSPVNIAVAPTMAAKKYSQPAVL
jgi:hypothetical protein